MNEPVLIVGGGLAGCEAAWQAARRGARVTLVDMKPGAAPPAHSAPTLAELVCSNSLKANRVTSASGLLKAEMRRVGSLILDVADACTVPAGGALAVDREAFSLQVTERLKAHPGITLEEQVVEDIPDAATVVIATGPLTQGRLPEAIAEVLGVRALHFFDAAAPLIDAESIDRSVVFAQSRYQRGGDDYLNCPMDKETYLAFQEALADAEVVPMAHFERKALFEGCVPIEILAGRGTDTMRFGPLKPVGLTDPATGQRPYAVVQLRQDDLHAAMYNMVGFQTRLRFGEQRRVFSMIPGLEQARFLRYGVMHRNMYLDAPGLLTPAYESVSRPGLFFAGQMTGVEGYVESAASGLVAGINAARRARGEPPVLFPATTVTGALAQYVSAGSPGSRGDFQPMNANYGILPPLDRPVPGRRAKEERNQMLADRALTALAALPLLSPDPQDLV